MIDTDNTLMVSDFLQAISRDCVVPGMSVVVAFEGSPKLLYYRHRKEC